MYLMYCVSTKVSFRGYWSGENTKKLILFIRMKFENEIEEFHKELLPLVEPF